MKKQLLALITALCVISVGGAAFAELTVKTITSENKLPDVKRERYATAVATIQAIDLDKRIVTLKNRLGQIFDVKVVPEAKNLPQLKIGDLVIIKYHQAVSAKVYKPGEAPQIPEQASMKLETAKEGAKPGLALTSEATITATIESINKKKPSVTLKTQDGKTLVVKVEEPKLLENVKAGDEVVITYSEAFAVSVEKAKKKSKKK